MPNRFTVSSPGFTRPATSPYLRKSPRLAAGECCHHQLNRHGIRLLAPPLPARVPAVSSKWKGALLGAEPMKSEV